MATILLVDDQEDLRFALAKAARKEGCQVLEADSGAMALEHLTSAIIDIIFLDIGLPDANGIELISRIRQLNDDAEIVMLTGLNDAKTAVNSLRAGACDYMVKPFDLLEFKRLLARLLGSRLSTRQAGVSMEERGVSAIIGGCPAMLRVKDAVRMAAEVRAAVLITGETGTGKELIARAIHDSQEQVRGIFVKVDCGTLSANLFESELFGHDRGAFTDARADKKGLVELAHGGTLFLDEIGNLPIELQPKLLRLIEESTFRRVGGLKDIQVDLRIVAATNADIASEIDQGRFREDLFYRLNVIPIHLPPLRQRGQDVITLAQKFLHTCAQELRKEIQGFTQDALDKLLAHDWPGNIREMRNLIEREVIFSRSGWINLSGLRLKEGETVPARTELLPLKEMEQRYIQQVLRQVHNNKSKAARILGISRTTLRDKLKMDIF